MIRRIIIKLTGSGVLRFSFFKILYNLYINVINIFYKNGKIITLKYGSNTLKYKVKIKDGFVSQNLRFIGLHEKSNTQAFIDILKEGDTCIDIGANIGYFTILSGYLVGPSGKVYGFEPSTYNFNKLETNISLNPKLKNIYVDKIGIGDKNETKELYTHNNIGQNSLVVTGNGKSEYIEIRRFDDYFDNIAHFDPSKVKLIKIDIEGYEYRAFKSMQKFILENNSFYILFEFSPDLYKLIDDQERNKLIDFIDKNGFEIEVVELGHEKNILIDRKKVDINFLKNFNAGQVDLLLYKK